MVAPLPEHVWSEVLGYNTLVDVEVAGRVARAHPSRARDARSAGARSRTPDASWKRRKLVEVVDTVQQWRAATP